MPATYNSPLHTAQLAALANGAARPKARAHGGTLHTLRVAYSLSATTEETEDDVINLGFLPPGATVLPGLSYVDCEDPGTTLVLKVGITGNPAAFADGITLSSGGNIRFTSGTLPASALVPITTTENTLVFATVASADALTDAKKLQFVITYELYH